MRRPRASSRKNAEDRNLIEILEMPYALSRPYAAPPDVPPERARALQEAFMATHKDPAYLADAEKVGIEISPISGARDPHADRADREDAGRAAQADREPDRRRRVKQRSRGGNNHEH